MNTLKKNFQEILHYPSAIAGLAAVLFLVLVSIYAMIAIPYRKAIELWRGGEEVWYANPKFAPPAWINYFRSQKLPVSFHANSADGGMEKVVTPGSGDTSTIVISHTFDFEADAYPQELMLYFTTTYKDKLPFASISLFTPDGREIRIADTGLAPQQNLRFSQEPRLVNRYGGGQQQDVMPGLFSDPKI